MTFAFYFPQQTYRASIINNGRLHQRRAALRMFSYFALNFREHQIAIVGYSVCTRGRREGRQPRAGVEDVFILCPESQSKSNCNCWLFSLHQRGEGGRWGCFHTSPWISEKIKLQLCWLFSLYHREEGGRWGCIHTSPWISENIKLQSLVIQFVQGGRGRDVIVIEGGRWGCFNTSPWISENIKVKLLAIQSAPEGGGRDVSRRRALRMFSYFALNLRDHHIGYADVRVEVFL